MILLVWASPRLEKVYLTNNELMQKEYQHQNQHHQNYQRDRNIIPLDLRSIQDWKLTDLLLISDIDGNLHGVERNSGGLLWSLPIDDPLVKISTNVTNASNETYNNTQSNILWFVEPYQDGSLYYFTPKFGLNKLPTSIKNLVLESPFSLSGDDKVYTGSRKTSLFTINIHTGEIISSFGTNDEKCPVPNTHSNDKSKIRFHTESEDTIMIGKTIYELSIFSKEHTNVVWNVTYAQWGPNNIDNDLIMQNQQSLDKLYFTPFHDKSLLAINKNLGTPVWISKLPSLAVNVFDIFENKNYNDHVILPHPLKVLNELQVSEDTNNNDLCFLNKTSNGNEWFAMSFVNYPTLIKSAPISPYQMSLYKLSHSIPSEVDVEFLSNFKVSNTPLVDHLINGIHQTNHLTADTMYQPVSNFDNKANPIKQISDGRTSEPPVDNNDSHNENSVPDVMNGFVFRDRKDESPYGRDVSTLVNSNNQDVLVFDRSRESQKDLSQKDDNATTTTIESLSLIKRICEDLIVILILLVLLMVFGKLGKLTKKFQKFIDVSSSSPNTPIPQSEKTFSNSPHSGNDKTENLDLEINKYNLLEKDHLPASIEIRDADSINTTTRSSSISDGTDQDLLDPSLTANEQSTNHSRSSSNGTVTTSNSTSDQLSSSKQVKKVTIVSPDDSLEQENSKPSVSEEKVEITTGNQSPEELNPLGIVTSENTDPGDADNDNDNDNEQEQAVTKKKRKRGSRGGKRGGKGKKKNKSPDDTNGDLGSNENNPTDDGIANGDDVESGEQQDKEEVISTKSLIKTIQKQPSTQKLPLKKLQIENNLVISDKVLGYGSHGTVVYEGTFENRPVAVKRMLLDFYDIANHEVRLLQESDDHPNVIRYFCSQSSESEKFLYIALELCLCSLEDITEKSKLYPQNLRLNEYNINNVLHQLVSGLHYLHSLKIVHRDLKPQNILVADTMKKPSNNKNQDASAQTSSIRLLISDFGLCKKLDADQSSFRATTQHAASGTSGWRAPELLLHHDLLEISPETISSVGSSSRHSIITNGNTPSTGNGKRLTKAIDIFSLGCVFFYILTNGNHPFGDRYLREGNIIKGEYDLSLLKFCCPTDYVEASHLISVMISHNPKLRPNTFQLMKHPYFWGMNKKLEFLLKVSDRFEIERRDPPSDLLLKLESVAERVHQGDWHAKFDDEFMNNLGKYRKYNTEKLMDLLRALRNKYHHFNDMPPKLQEQMSPLPNGFYKYFNNKFPHLLMEIYFIVEETLKHEHVFEEFY